MTDKEKLGKITAIVLFSLLGIIFLATLACTGIAFVKVKYFDDFHQNFLAPAFMNTFFLVFSQNILFISILFVTLIFSLLIDKTFLINLENSRLFFAQVVRIPFFIVVVLLIYHFIALEFINPALNQKLETIRNNTKRADILLSKGHEHYRLKDFENAGLFYNQYLLIVEQDDYIDELLRKIDIELMNIREAGDEPDLLPETVFDYIKLAEYYFAKEEYLTAYYYYQFVLETGSAESRIAKSRIGEIKKIFEYKSSIQEDLNIKWMTMPEKAVRRIYEVKDEAIKSIAANKYHDAYFSYKQLLEIDNNIRDVRKKRDEAYVELSKISTKYAKFINSLLLPGKKNAIFMPMENVILYIGEMKKVVDLESIKNIYLCYDIRIYYLNDNFEVRRVIASPFGEYKYKRFLSLYSYSDNNPAIEYYPFLEKMNSAEYRAITEKIRKIPIPHRIKPGSLQKYMFDNILSNDQKNLLLSFYAYDFFNENELVLKNGNDNEYMVGKIRGVLSDGCRRFFDSRYTRSGDYYLLNPQLDEEQKMKLGLLYNSISYRFFSYDEPSGKKTEPGDEKKDLEKPSYAGLHEIYPFIYRVTLDADLIYDFSYDYGAALDLPLRRLTKLNTVMSKVLMENETFSFGFNTNFIKAASADKSSRLFMFFYLNMFAIAIAWRTRSKHIGFFPWYYIPGFPLMLAFLYLSIKTLENLSTIIFTLLANNLTFVPLMLIMGGVNILLILFSFIMLASSRLDT